MSHANNLTYSNHSDYWLIRLFLSEVLYLSNETQYIIHNKICTDELTNQLLTSIKLIIHFLPDRNNALIDPAQVNTGFYLLKSLLDNSLILLDCIKMDYATRLASSFLNLYTHPNPINNIISFAHLNFDHAAYPTLFSVRCAITYHASLFDSHRDEKLFRESMEHEFSRTLS